MLAAHTDTVFPEGTDLSIRKEGNRYYCPGINDDTHAAAEIMAVAQIDESCMIFTQKET